jgi:putative ABC transport system substrate-binding protein
MNSRRKLLRAFGAGMVTAPFCSEAQVAEKAFRVGHLSGSGVVASKSYVDAFRDGMRVLGYVEARNFVLDERYAEGKIERLPALVQELIERKPDVLLVSTTPGNLAAKAATSTIPIVMVLVADPIGAGIVQSLVRPGGNITGITNIVAELGGKRLEILKALVPKASRVAVIVNPNDQNTPLQMRNAEEGANRLGIRIDPILKVRNIEELKGAFEEATRSHSAAAIRMIDPVMFILRKETAALAIKHRLPVIYPTQEDAEAGGLISYGANIPEQYRQAATLIHKIRQGAKPADLPVEQPTKFDLVINLKTAKALGLTIPQSLLVSADKVIE